MSKLLKVTIASSILSVAIATSVVFAEAERPNATSTQPTTHSINLACVQSAVQTRESALQSAWQTFSSAGSSALTARASALQAAWGNAEKQARQTAVKKAWRDFNTAIRAAKKVHKTANREAWAAFRTARKTCGTNSSDGDEDSGENL